MTDRCILRGPMPPRTLILGADGGVGLALARVLDPGGAAIPQSDDVARGDSIDTTDGSLRVWVKRLDTWHAAMPASEAEAIEGSMRDGAAVRRALEGVE